MHLKTAVYSLVLLAAMGFCVPIAWACSCGRAAPRPCPGLKDIGVAFVGTVVDIQDAPEERLGMFQNDGMNRYRFLITETFSGIKASEVNVYSGRGGADCSYHFQRGETYFVTPYESKGRLVATICSDTQPAATAGPLISELRALRDGKPYASLYGVLRKTQQPYGWTAADHYDEPLPNINVELASADKKFAAQTDADGVYRFYGLPAGTYQVRADLPPNLEIAQIILNAPFPPVTVPDNACYQQDLDALPTGRIRGRVIGPDGTVLKNADVALFRTDRYKEDGFGWWEYQNEERGRFDFQHVSPGSYLLVFHNSGRSDPDMPFPRTFYPAALDVKSATPIILGEGQQLLDADIHVGAGSPTRTLSVRVHWSETPTPDDVYVSGVSADGDNVFAQQLSAGLFEVQVFRGKKYLFCAHQSCGDSNTGTPIGRKETTRIEFDGSDDRTSEINLSLTDATCKPYQRD